ncbi:MAG: bacteriocin fulvocin C-related protein [Gemmatimonadetes bacterium]|nr:bacteriocin fulvocin C-related protein [Gemmatimonadota bacterium]MYE91908.1 bacteriocin fulvocin C-related protein [Gemmatimonadota bacterium]MYJ12549.1 bacteriocin fulvocin C-related protein [Gemmatimonadota bacterium]
MSKLFGIIPLACIAIWAVPAPGNDASSNTPVPECELAKEWVAANLDALPTTLDAFGEHSLTFRRAIYGALDTEIRISLWRENLAAVAHEATLPEQRLFLERVSRDLDGYVRGTAPASEIDAVAEEARAILGMDLAGRAIAVLGSVPESAVFAVENGDLEPDCACSTEEDWCWLTSFGRRECRDDEDYHCDDLESGCGDWWQAACDGMCFKKKKDESTS